MSAALQRGAERFTRALAMAVQSRLLYPPGHPSLTGAHQHAAVEARTLASEVGELPPLFVVRGAFYLGPNLLPGASLGYEALRRRFEETGVKAVEIAPHVTESDVALLVSMLTGDAPTTASTGGITVNAVEPTFAVGEVKALANLRRAYDLGVAAAEQAADALGTQEDGKLDTVAAAIEALTEEIVRDPSRAMLLAALRARDEDDRRRAVDVAVLAVVLARTLGLDDESVTAVGVGGLLRDVGMLSIHGDEFIHTGPLSNDQWDEIRRHPLVGASMLLSAEGGLRHVAAAIALEHHVGMDGSGYPNLPETRPPSPPARIVAVADGYVALTTDRPHRIAEERRQALATIAGEAGTRYDERVVEALVQALGPYPIGAIVELAGGEAAVVVRQNPQHPERPVVRVVRDPHGHDAPPFDLDLAARDGADSPTRIVRCLPPDAVELDESLLVLDDDSTVDEATQDD